MIKFTFSFENGTFEISKLKNSYSLPTQSSPTLGCLWPSCVSSSLPTSWFVFLHTMEIIPKETTVNCFQRKEARVNNPSLKSTESALPCSRERKENGNTMEVSPCWEGLWNGEECATGTPATCRDVRNALRGRLNHHKSHLLFTIEDLLSLTGQLTSRTKRKLVSSSPFHFLLSLIPATVHVT